MVKHLLHTSEIRELADRALGTQLDLAHSPAVGFASGAIVPIALGPHHAVAWFHAGTSRRLGSY